MVDKKRIERLFSALGVDMERHSTPTPEMPLFTSGVQESRAWTVPKGSSAPRAAREIHTDFEKGFIRAEVVSYEDYVNLGGEKKSKEAGKMRVEGKDYLVEDGDVIYFRFNI